MDLFRRLLGISPDSTSETSDDGSGIVITNDTTPPKESQIAPPEPIIETPTPETVEASARETAEAAEEGRALPSADEVEFQKDNAAAFGTRPLPPPETIVARPGQRIVFGARSDVGMVRGNNQDAMYCLQTSGESSDDLPDIGLFMVADGMGGHQEGERASAIAVRIVIQHVVEHILTAILQQKMDDPERPAIADILRQSFQEANEAVSEQIPEGGTTATVALVIGDVAYMAHVGDSRAYLITNEGMEQVTRDHSLVRRLIELDQLTEEEADQHPQRNVLYRAIGQSDTLDVDAITRRLPPRSRLLICSDGLWNYVSETLILDTITQHSNTQEVCDLLVNMANERGGPDNITVVLLQMPG